MRAEQRIEVAEKLAADLIEATAPYSVTDAHWILANAVELIDSMHNALWYDLPESGR